MNKFVFKAYSNIFPKLFLQEKERIASRVKTPLLIEHVGSTSIPDLGGKGIIDIAIATCEQDISTITTQLQSLGYEFRPTFSTPDRSYFIIYLPDPEEETRRYHIHLTYPESNDWKGLIGFRDYLLSHPKEMLEYAEVKRKAAIESSGDGEKYRQLKEPIIKDINKKITSS